ncbi:MAG: bifunctional methylenetetrahydrofolate dehydrogenase/methenyltetrahydrofolate cyclohydrolase FolD [Lachnospiraceae bacterium]|nr:bifunctional methylenetetrahydrofolate dehydrogenase/methenyltetrahydrofolate cyclohydrolase FolD [Lachnospiraceae bacterium]
MSAILIDGKETAARIREEVKAKANELLERGIPVTLAVVMVGDNPASAVYVRNKQKACDEVGILSVTHHLEEATSEEALLKLVHDLNEDDNINGILVQLPLPEHINEKKILLAIDPDKDVDGFHPMNVGRLCTGEEGFVSCTPAGIIELLQRYEIATEGKECVIIGRSNIVGKPMIQLMLKENATVTVCHSKTKNLQEVCARADILIAALGKERFVKQDFVKEGAVVIDVGINRDENNKLCGDVDFETVKEKASYITPVPGGVGPMTIAMLLKNCCIAGERQHR